MVSFLYSYRALVGGYYSGEKGNGSDSAYISCRMNGMWQEESNITPTVGEIKYHFGNDVAISGDTDIIGSPHDVDMGLCSGSVYVFFVRNGLIWEEVQKLAPAYGKASCDFGIILSLSDDTAVIGAYEEN